MESAAATGSSFTRLYESIFKAPEKFHLPLKMQNALDASLETALLINVEIIYLLLFIFKKGEHWGRLA